MAEDTSNRLPWLAPIENVGPTEEIREQAALAPESRAAKMAAEAHLSRMSVQARTLRENFVAEYLYDFDPVAAAMRLGYISKTARNTAARLMREPAVQRLIREQQQAFAKRVEINQDRILAGLLKEATREGVGTSHSARVAAWTSMGKIVGVVGPEQNVNVNVSGVMEVPPVPTTDSWEAQAQSSQEKLKQDVQK